MARRSATHDRTVAAQCIRALVRALHQSARTVERGTGITNAQLFVLQQLGDAHALSINELAERALTRQNAVSTVVERLVRQGLVRRARAADDARRVVVTLTAAGRELLERAPEPPTTRLLTALAEMPAATLPSLARGLRALVHAMGLSEELAGMLFERDDESVGTISQQPIRPPARPLGRPAARRPGAHVRRDGTRAVP
jgi:DNA-binding MarR family transcriptional regulator